VIIAGISTGDNTSVMIATAENIVLLTYFREADRIDLQFQIPGISLVRAMSGFCVQEERYEPNGGTATSSTDQIRRTFGASLSLTDKSLRL
jgi:hypothetical protein